MYSNLDCSFPKNWNEFLDIIPYTYIWTTDTKTQTIYAYSKKGEERFDRWDCTSKINTQIIQNPSFGIGCSLQGILLICQKLSSYNILDNAYTAWSSTLIKALNQIQNHA